MKTTKHYRVCTGNGSHLSLNGYSKYYDRYKMFDRGEIQQNEIYGLEQAIEHIAEYLGTLDEYTKNRNAENLFIEEVITIISPVAYEVPKPILNYRYAQKLVRPTREDLLQVIKKMGREKELHAVRYREENEVNLSMPEIIEYFEYKLEEAKMQHEGLKNGTIERSHSFSLTYAKKAVNEMQKNLDLAKRLWQ